MYWSDFLVMSLLGHLKGAYVEEHSALTLLHTHSKASEKGGDNKWGNFHRCEAFCSVFLRMGEETRGNHGKKR